MQRAVLGLPAGPLAALHLSCPIIPQTLLTTLCNLILSSPLYTHLDTHLQEAEAFKLEVGDFAIMEEVAADVAQTKSAWDRWAVALGMLLRVHSCVNVWVIPSN
jgi:hypothetical protein